MTGLDPVIHAATLHTRFKVRRNGTAWMALTTMAKTITRTSRNEGQFSWATA